MNTLTETLARATLRGPGGRSRARRTRRLPARPTFYLERAPTDEDVRAFAEKLEAFPELRSRARPANAKSEKTLRRLRWEVIEGEGYDVMKRFDAR